MKRNTRLVRVMAMAGASACAAGAAGLALAALLLGSSLPPEDLASAQALLLPRWPVLVLVLLLVLAVWTGLALMAAQAVYRRWLAPPAQLLEQAQVLLQPDAEHALPAPEALTDAATKGLASVLNALVAQRGALQRGVAEQLAAGTLALAQERGRLAALMHELLQGVIVCNRDGRILLYNRRARLQFQALGGTAPGQHLIGLGRSIYAVFDPAQLQHALDLIQRRLQHGADAPAAQFVAASRAGQLLRVQVAPVLDEVAGPSRPTPELDGFVLMLDNITREAERETAHTAELQQVTQALRAGLGSMEAAVRALQAQPLLAVPEPADALAELNTQMQALTARLQALDQHAAQHLATRWPQEDLLGADLVAAALTRLQAAAAQVASAQAGKGAARTARTGLLEVDDSLWLHVDSTSLLQVLEHLARRLLAEFEQDSSVLLLQLRLQREGEHALLDLVWPVRAMSTETVMGWETEPLLAGPAAGQGGGSPLTARDVLRRHGASLGFERDRSRQQAFFRLRLSCATPPAPPPVPPTMAEPGPANSLSDAREAGSRPESYDFDLFQPSPTHLALDERPLAELTFTVFDTETTGLAPTQGDQILQIGAVRVLRGRLLRHEAYEQLVDPQRGIPAAGIPIHGITPQMVQGQPVLELVLPVFHAYAADTVLVAHNAAFDMRFLQLAETRCAVRFEQPVLDTLLLSAVVHPQQASHRLEDIAERFGVVVVGRHTALGDALVTAQVFVRLLPLLAEQGIHTLAQAREASRQTRFARLQY
jgi:DNA polymerase-3 subunit epsilon